MTRPVPKQNPVTNDDNLTPEDTSPPVPGSFAEELAASGAAPVEVDTNELMRRLQEQVDKQQALIDKMAAERGIPTDPVAALVLTFHDHLAAQANANPVHAADYADLLTVAKTMVDNSEGLTVDNALYVREAADELQEKHPQHELAYVRSVAKELHRFLLNPENKR